MLTMHCPTSQTELTQKQLRNLTTYVQGKLTTSHSQIQQQPKSQTTTKRVTNLGRKLAGWRDCLDDIKKAATIESRRSKGIATWSTESMVFHEPESTWSSCTPRPGTELHRRCSQQGSCRKKGSSLQKLNCWWWWRADGAVQNRGQQLQSMVMVEARDGCCKGSYDGHLVWFSRTAASRIESRQ